MIKTRYSSERLVIFYMINQQLFHLDLFLHKIKKAEHNNIGLKNIIIIIIQKEIILYVVTSVLY